MPRSAKCLRRPRSIGGIPSAVERRPVLKGHSPRSRRSGRGLEHCLQQTSYFAGFTQGKSQMAPCPRLSDLFRQTLGSSFSGRKSSLKRRNATTHLSPRPRNGRAAASGSVFRVGSLIPCVVKEQEDRKQWLAPAGLRGGTKLEVSSTAEAASHAPSLCCPSSNFGTSVSSSRGVAAPLWFSAVAAAAIPD